MPLPSLLPTIPLQEKERENFTFMVPTYNKSQLVRRYHWKILSQGMSNSLIPCQYFMQNLLKIICVQSPQFIIYHYVDDSLLGDSKIKLF